jgi:hypothetical protein
MPRYKIKCASAISFWQEAIVEVEAESAEAALAKAEALDQEGKLEWHETASHQPEATEYTVIDTV